MKRLSIFLAALGVALAVGCGGGDTIVQTSGQNQIGVSATGTGKVVGEPDVAVITVGVNVQRATVEQARQDAADAQSAVIDSLKANGVKDKDIQTVQFSVSPQYDYRQPSTNGSPRIIGYTVNNVVTAKVRNLDTTGKAIDDATKAGGNDAVVQGVSFTIDDPAPLQAEARKQAVENARTQAEQLAKASGNSLGKLLSITESGGPVPIARDLAAPSAASGSSTTPVEPGQLQVSITVNLLYAIE